MVPLRIRDGKAVARLTIQILIILAVLISTMPSAFAADGDAERGKYIAVLGGCESCHTDKKRNGAPYAGGVVLKSPFGTFHVPNITPDKESGIGGWSDADFIRAMTKGRAPDGSPYYPSFPYTSYTKMTRQDLLDLKAYLDTVPPVRNQVPPHDMNFPYNIRWALLPWQWLFFKSGTYKPDPNKSAEWNRGAYLVNGPGHCGECHTARNFFGATDHSNHMAGTRKGPEGDPIPNITQHERQGIGGWTKDEIVDLLKDGALPDGDYVGSTMADVVDNNTSHWHDADLQATATYLMSLEKRATP